MLIERDPARDTEDILRALGALLDAYAARGVLIREAPDGLLVRALVAPTLQARMEDAYVPMEREFGSAALLEQRLEAVARRGTGHRAGPIERALRQIGRRIDEELLASFVLIQHEQQGAWLLWHGLGAYREAELVTFGQDDIERLEAAASAARGAIAGDGAVAPASAA
jgi:hypothetical protein